MPSKKIMRYDNETNIDINTKTNTTTTKALTVMWAIVSMFLDATEYYCDPKDQLWIFRKNMTDFLPGNI